MKLFALFQGIYCSTVFLISCKCFAHLLFYFEASFLSLVLLPSFSLFPPSLIDFACVLLSLMGWLNLQALPQTFSLIFLLVTLVFRLIYCWLLWCADAFSPVVRSLTRTAAMSKYLFPACNACSWVYPLTCADFSVFDKRLQGAVCADACGTLWSLLLKHRSVLNTLRWAQLLSILKPL